MNENLEIQRLRQVIARQNRVLEMVYAHAKGLSIEQLGHIDNALNYKDEHGAASPAEGPTLDYKRIATSLTNLYLANSDKKPQERDRLTAAFLERELAQFEGPKPSPRCPDEHSTRMVEVVDHLVWALDMMGSYEGRLIQFGDPRELVYSDVHKKRLADAKGAIEGAWQMLWENSECNYCKDGNVPLAGWHRFINREIESCCNKSLAQFFTPSAGTEEKK